MSMVAVVFKVYSKDGEFDKLLPQLKPLGPAGSQDEDVGFGIKLLKVLFKFDDSKTSSSAIEERIRALPSVSEVEVLEESLL
jgi:translation elongation factor EF-1beta